MEFREKMESLNLQLPRIPDRTSWSDARWIGWDLELISTATTSSRKSWSTGNPYMCAAVFESGLVIVAELNRVNSFCEVYVHESLHDAFTVSDV
jgi:hypothetical protein